MLLFVYLRERVERHGEHGAGPAEEVEGVDGAAGEVDRVVEVREGVRLRAGPEEALAGALGGVGV